MVSMIVSLFAVQFSPKKNTWCPEAHELVLF